MRSLAVGGDHTCAIRHDRTVACWGSQNSVPDGRGRSRRDAVVPTSVRNVRSVVALAAGAQHSCAVRTDGRVVCWGADSDGQSGRWPLLERTGTWTVPAVFGAVAVAAGGRHTCAIVSAGSVVCWGANDFGQSGSPPISDAVRPTVVTQLRPAVALALGEGHSCALHADETVSCWGNANGFQVNGVPVEDTAVPVTVGPLPD